MEKTIKEKLYNLTDSFLVEAKNQDGKYRSLERLNQDRHLFIDNLMQLFGQTREDVLNEVLKSASGSGDWRRVIIQMLGK